MGTTMSTPLNILVLGGGPDREREVSLKSAASVAAALRTAGHTVTESDVRPDDLSALEKPSDVVFPVLHGRWGEGGALQRLLDAKKVPYVGCRSRAAWLGMDKCASKQVAQRHGVPTPPYQLLGPLTPITLTAPMAIKALTEGSSYGVWICPTQADVEAARKKLHAHFAFGMAEQYVAGREFTVGILDQTVLPPIWIKPADGHYTFDAKYQRDDTQYLFDLELPEAVVDQIKGYALAVFNGIGARHLSRVDFIVDAQNKPWFLEINTLPGFTDHSLLPKAAAKIGYDMPHLCDMLVRLAIKDGVSR